MAVRKPSFREFSFSVTGGPALLQEAVCSPSVPSSRCGIKEETSRREEEEV